MWRLPTSPNSGFVDWTVDTDLTILWLSLPTVANVNFGVSTNGLKIADWNGVDTGGILFMGTWNQVPPTNVMWFIGAGQTVRISKNAASDIDVLINYVAHVG